MTIIGFNFTKINVEKTAPVKGKININNNIKIIDVQENNLSLGKSEQKGLKFLFEFNSIFEPKIGSINLKGDVIFLSDTKKTEDILSEWQKKKTMPKEIMTSVLNTALNKCNIQALILSQQINLPAPIPLPKVQAQAPSKKS